MAYNGKAALITGASSGIGEAFARALAARSMDLLLTALPADEEQLRQLAHELSARHRVRSEVVTADLSEPGGAAALYRAAERLGIEIDTLVNSAGFGGVGAFGGQPLERQLAMIRLNVEGLVALCGLCLPRMAARRHGAIINVASTAALSPLPYSAVYGASKAFVLSFSEALWAEYRQHGVRVVVTCPGPVASRFHERSQVAAPRFTLSCEAVVGAALKALDRNRPTVVQRVQPFGLVFATLSSRLVPRRLRLSATEKVAQMFFRQG